MAFLRPIILFAFIVALIPSCMAQQPDDNQLLFTISVAPPTKAKDVQVRYSYSGDFGNHESSIASPTDDNQIVIKTGVDGKTAKSFRLVAYVPGCQFVTISVDDLSATRQGQFQCTALNTVQFNGHIDLSSVGQKSLTVRALYVCDWCPQFLGMNGGAISPFVLDKTGVASDGTFLFDLPNFAADPLWSSLSSRAWLSFTTLDANTGEPFSALQSRGAGAAKTGEVPVAPLYSALEFQLQR
ncbi:MAG TPA: hypothetical protein VKW06_17845 [Candidatus Angelobacter sp.]|nr:hypothetical protein [Candidatus Angelobacter sp.]